jgi:hypothetical protein
MELGVFASYYRVMSQRIHGKEALRAALSKALDYGLTYDLIEADIDVKNQDLRNFVSKGYLGPAKRAKLWPYLKEKGFLNDSPISQEDVKKPLASLADDLVAHAHVLRDDRLPEDHRTEHFAAVVVAYYKGLPDRFKVEEKESDEES